MGGSENGLIEKFCGLDPDADIGTAEKLREAFEASAQIEDERVRLDISGDW